MTVKYNSGYFGLMETCTFCCECSLKYLILIRQLNSLNFTQIFFLNMLETYRVNSDSKDFQSLVKLLDEELNQTYGIIQKQYDKLNVIENLETVVVGYVNGFASGCGCFKKYDAGSIEIKRMFVKKEERGSGIAAIILMELEKWAKEKGYTSSILETGIKQAAAMKFYAKMGYNRIENYGAYIGNENSLCMAKKLI